MDKRQLVIPVVVAGVLGIIILMRPIKFKSKSASKSVKSGIVPKSIAYPSGISNIGNSCYLNSLAQCLRSLPSFKTFLFSAKKSLLRQSALALIAKEENKPHDFMRNLIKLSNRFYGGQEEDAHEALIYILEQLTMKTNPFEGSLVRYTHCEQCEYNSRGIKSVFNHITVSVPAVANPLPFKTTEKSGVSGYPIEQILSSFLDNSESDIDCKNCRSQGALKSVEEKLSINRRALATLLYGKDSKTLEDIDETNFDTENIKNKLPFKNCFDKRLDVAYFEYCNLISERNLVLKNAKENFKKEKMGHSMTVKTCLVSLPKILCVHVSRGWGNYKINTHVSFGESLDVENLGDISNYRLRAFIEHIGTAHGGHYVAYRKFKDDWFCCSDDDVKKVNWEIVRGAQAYLLFYEKD